MLKKKAKRRTSLGEKAITLIALVVTIVILLILAAVTITMTLGENGLFQRSKDAKEITIKAMSDEEVELAVSNLKMETTIRKLTQEGSRKFLEDDLKKSDKDTTVTINGNDLKVKHRGNNYNVDQDCNLTDEGDFDAAEWDKTAAPENVFVWESDDPNNEGYNTIIGYNATVDNYPILRYPSRCKIIEEDSYKTNTKLNLDENLYKEEKIRIIRNYTSNIKKKEFPETIIEIGGEGFFYNNVESLKLPKSLKKIGDYAFINYSKIEVINIPKNVESIGLDIFRDCKKLISVNILGNIKQINDNAFGQWNSNEIEVISIKGAEDSIKGAPWGATNAKIIWNYEESKEYMTEEEKKEWDKTAAPENIFVWQSNDKNSPLYGNIVAVKEEISNYRLLKIPSRCTSLNLMHSIEEKARALCKNIKKIELPKSVQRIEYSAFYSGGKGFSGLEEINIPESVYYIGDYAFYGCDSLKKINIEKKAYSISGAPWENKLENIRWKENLDENYMSESKRQEWDKNAAEESAFIWASDDKNATNDYGTIIGFNEPASKYTILKIPSRCKAIIIDDVYDYEKRSFTSNLKKIIIPKSVIYIGKFNKDNWRGYFYNSLKEIKIEGKSTRVYQNALRGFSGITINLTASKDSISGAPWGADNATVNWNCDSEQ